MRDLEFGGGALERGIRRAVGRTLERGIRDAPVHKLRDVDGNSGQTSRTRSHRVITASNRWPSELVEVLGAVRR